MVKKALAGLWATCVLLTLNPSATSAATSDVVLYASDAANLHGNWVRVSDATAAGGQLVSSVDKGWGTTNAVLASPADYFEFTFNAVANTPYHVWLRQRATANSKYNDAMYAQFSDAVDANGSPLYGIGTTTGLTVNLATDAAASSLNGWGWQDGAYWLAQQTTVRFASSGSHTLRIQTREDGVQIDQVVLSALAYLTNSPGLVSRDTKIVAKPIAASTPYGANAFTVPGTIEARNFDNGGEGIASHDLTGGNSGGAYRQSDVDIEAATEAGYNVGWIAPGEWLKYSVNVSTTGNYVLEARVASAGQGGTFHVEFGGNDVTGAMTIPNTGGWQNWTTVSTAVALPAGPQIMRVVFDTVGVSAVGNLNWVRLSTLASTPFTGKAISVPGTIRADNFDNGGEGLAYHDLTAGNSGGQYRNTDVDLEASTAGGYNVGWMDTGEWLAYTVDVATAGPYTLQFQAASAIGGGQLHASFGGANSTTVVVPNTGGWQKWTTVSATANLTAGTQVMKLLVDTGGFNVTGMTLALTPPPPPPWIAIAPTTYTAISDRITRPKPALPVPGPAGSLFVDPSFGSRILRVTDANSRPAGVRVSYRTSGASRQVGWNLTSTYFFVMSTDGTVVPYAFDGTKMMASRIPGAGDGGLTLAFTNEPEFSATNPNLIYGAGGGARTVSQYDFAAKVYSPVVNLDTVVSGLTGYVGGQASGGMTSDNLMVFFGGPSQDQHHYALWFPVNNPSAKKLLDTTASSLNGVPTAIALNFKLHSASIDRSGRYVLLYPTVVDQAAPRYASQEYIWDTVTDVFTAMTSGGKDGGPSVRPYGHEAPGFGYNINADCCTSSTWDAAQWQVRSLADPLITADLIRPVMTPKEIYLADHTSWGNAQPNTLVPVISGNYRFGDNTTPWRAWDDEILAIETGAPAGTGGTVWRFAHHRSAVAGDVNPLAISFWYTPRPNVSRNGRWVIFTSNWEKTIGTDSRDGSFRTDVFLVELK